MLLPFTHATPSVASAPPQAPTPPPPDPGTGPIAAPAPAVPTPAPTPPVPAPIAPPPPTVAPIEKGTPVAGPPITPDISGEVPGYAWKGAIVTDARALKAAQPGTGTFALSELLRDAVPALAIYPSPAGDAIPGEVQRIPGQSLTFKGKLPGGQRFVCVIVLEHEEGVSNG